MKTSKTSPTLSGTWNELVPSYQSYTIKSLWLRGIVWDPRYSVRIARISEKRAASRCANYLDPTEIERVRSRISRGKDASIRFGVKKEGHGYHGERGDFCLVGGLVEGRHLHLFYRSLELIGGFAYDLCLVQELGRQLGINWRTLSIVAVRARVFALQGNSNQKLFPKLQKIFSE